MHWLEYLLFLAVVLLAAEPVGRHLAAIFAGTPAFGDRFLRPLEVVLLRWSGVDAAREMSAGVYVLCFVAFGVTGAAFLFLLQLAQQWLPLGPEAARLTTPMTIDLATNTAASFATTTTWQSYSGETTLRYLTQLLGLVAQNFLAGAAGLAVGMAFIRGFVRENSSTIGNFWVDLVRALVRVLLPLSLVGSLVLVWQGVPMNLDPYAEATTLEGKTQMIAQGPVAALEFIKNLGTNGGGFFGVNGAHPYANPTPLTNLIGMFAIAVIPAALPIAFGRMVGRPRAGWLLLIVMIVLCVAGFIACDWAESKTPQALQSLASGGGNLEGKELRFGVEGSVLAAVVTSNGACGSNSSMHGSFQPMGVLVLLVNMMLGEVTFGGLGAGLYSLMMVALVGVFLGGLMVGRTPEYLGKTIGISEAKLIALNALLTPAIILGMTGMAAISEKGAAAVTTNAGPRAFTEILFAYTSCMANNGQAMGGLNANNSFYNLTTIIPMLAGRFGLAALALALAGRLAAQGRKHESAGTLPCDTFTFGVLVLGSVLLIGALCFLPALALGPLAEHLQSVPSAVE